MDPSDTLTQSIPPEWALPVWAPRLRQSLIRRLYETDARGIYDDELLDEVGWGLRARCESFITAVEAANGRVKCPACGQVVLRHADADEILHCTCGWEMAWRAYFNTFQHKQLSGAEPVLALFVVDFLDRLTYGESSTPGTRAARAEWRQIVNQSAETWKDERLRRPPE